MPEDYVHTLTHADDGVGGGEVDIILTFTAGKRRRALWAGSSTV